MPRWLWIAVFVLLAAALAGYAGFQHLTEREPVPETSDYVIDMTEIRRLAAAPSDPEPIAIESELVARADLPRFAVFAGEPIGRPHPMVHVVFRVLYPDGSHVIIDAGMDEIVLAEMGDNAVFHAEAYAAVQQAFGRGGLIVVTHEHADHIRGLATFRPSEDLVTGLVMTKEQLDNSLRLGQVDFPDLLRDRLVPLEYEKYHAIASGVVLVKAAGHTPGSQMIFVALEDGREFLFLGDVAWHMDQIRNLHYRPRLVTDHLINEDRKAVLHQFRALHDLMQAEPDLRLVPSHDVEVREAYLRDGAIRETFSSRE